MLKCTYLALDASLAIGSRLSSLALVLLSEFLTFSSPVKALEKNRVWWSFLKALSLESSPPFFFLAFSETKISSLVQ